MDNKRKSLRDFTKDLSNALPFMEGRTKGETAELLGQVLTIRDFGFMQGENEKTKENELKKMRLNSILSVQGENEKTKEKEQYVCFILDNIKDKFYFGGQVLTDHLKEMQDSGYYEDIKADGLPILLTTKKSKSNQKYTAVTFYPEG